MSKRVRQLTFTIKTPATIKKYGVDLKIIHMASEWSKKYVASFDI